MSAISAANVQNLRNKTGAGMMDCKKALIESGGDEEAAVMWLRKKGLASAQAKADRATAEGLVGVRPLAYGQSERNGHNGQNGAVLLKLCCETDFVARNKNFHDFADEVLLVAAQRHFTTVAELSEYSDNLGTKMHDKLSHAIATIGENIVLGDLRYVSVEQGVVATYVHNAAAPDLGRIGVAVALESTAHDRAALTALGRQIAMHIAAMKPIALNVSDIDPTLIAKEREVLAEKANTSGKPEAIVNQMIEGGLKKFYAENVLLKQTFVIDNTRTIEQLLSDYSQELAATVQIKKFALLAI